MKVSLTVPLLSLTLAFSLFAGIDAARGLVTPSSTSFSLTFFQKVSKDKKSENILVSPFSASTALKMTLAGAEGQTESVMAKTLGVTSLADVHKNSKHELDSLRKPGASTILEIANALFAEKRISFKKTFLDINKSFYDAEVKSLEFKSDDALKEINGWVSSKTHGKIPSILNKIPPSAVLYLINAIYFKGKWAQPFDKGATQPGDFSLANGQTKKVQMMNAREKFRYLSNADFQAVDLPYADNRLSLTVFLPTKTTSLESFEMKLNSTNWATWMGRFRSQQGHLAMPRFKIEDSNTLNTSLKDMGMGVAFDATEADFKGMA
ncbi:MAG: serpin family protein, partial [Cyanobacteria bacterium]|nr:serpin family protein [Cyanobacteriota bacterium]